MGDENLLITADSNTIKNSIKRFGAIAGELVVERADYTRPPNPDITPVEFIIEFRTRIAQSPAVKEAAKAETEKRTKQINELSEQASREGQITVKDRKANGELIEVNKPIKSQQDFDKAIEKMLHTQELFLTWYKNKNEVSHAIQVGQPINPEYAMQLISLNHEAREISKKFPEMFNSYNEDKFKLSHEKAIRGKIVGLDADSQAVNNARIAEIDIEYNKVYYKQEAIMKAQKKEAKAKDLKIKKTAGPSASNDESSTNDLGIKVAGDYSIDANSAAEFKKLLADNAAIPFESDKLSDSTPNKKAGKANMIAA